LFGYERHVREFVRGALGDDPIDPSELGCADVVEFVASMTSRYSPASMKGVRTALRSFLRYLRGEATSPTNGSKLPSRSRLIGGCRRYLAA
jgi:hypothetical protein